ncbi:MAG: amidase family protein, partial [Phreatobacter sp.]|nr:amidase family protein [Phreatobacter sp.]
MTDAAAVLAQGAVATAEAIAAGETSARAVVETSLARIAASTERLHAFIAIMADEARAEADMLDTLMAHGHRRGPLHGV